MAKIYINNNNYLERKKLHYIYTGLPLIFFGLILIWLNYYLSGGIVISLVVFFMYFKLYKKADKMADRAGNYKDGIDGENIVLEELKKLSDEYIVFGNVKLPNSNLNNDFVVISQHGIFSIEVKAGGLDCMWKNCKQTMREALGMNNFLGKKYFVEPILVYTGKFAKVRFGKNKQKGVYIIRKEYLLDVITSAAINNVITADNALKIEELILSTGEFEIK